MNLRLSNRVKKALVLGAVCGAVLGMLLTFAAASKALGKKETAMAETETKLKKENKELQSQLTQKKTVEEAATLSTKGADKWELVFVNQDHPLDKAYQPELAEAAADCMVDARILEDTQQMLADAQAAGLKMHIISAYRSYDEQKPVFDDTMQNWINQGIGYFDAYQQTSLSVAVPGYSEHALGLAMDIVSEDYQELDDKQGETAESKWLAENCYKYGFIVRYPSDKSDITGIVYEPWHYRYVGKEAAKAITEKGITLEEYLGVK